jgi:squalene-associated FAD-dependent desaturase
VARRVSTATRPSRLAVVGAGWAGLAAAVHATSAGQRLTIFEMAPQVGGRARTVRRPDGMELDNGQHILIGAYTATLRVMDLVGADTRKLLMRLPLELRYPDGQGLKVARGPVLWGFALGVLGAQGWSLGERFALLRTALGWWRQGMRSPGIDTVSALCSALPPRVRGQLIEPLCVAAMNTPAERASATVFLRVLGDALFGTVGGSDLLLPRAGLSELFPRPAERWLSERGAGIERRRRVATLQHVVDGWRVDGEPFDAVVLACSAIEASRLVRPVAPVWAEQAAALRYEPIATVFLSRSSRPLPLPMLALHAGRDAPAQFVFDLDALGVSSRTLAFVVSGATRWLAAGMGPLAEAVRRQAQTQIPSHVEAGPAASIEAVAERRATFACVPGLQRPAISVAPGLFACGDYVQGPYPATLEGSVRSGLEAATHALQWLRSS